MVTRSDLDHVRWVGGGSGAGKSTTARRFAARYGVHHYSTDAATARHSATATAQEAPLLTEFLALGPDERWLDQSPETMLATFPWFHGEAFDRIVEDLLALGPEPVVAEGFRLLPDLVAPLIRERSHAVWLLPTPEFRRTVFDSRGGPSWSFIGTTSRPEQALENLLVRDAMFTARLAQDTARLGLEVVRVDGSVSEDALVERLADTFGYAEP